MNKHILACWLLITGVAVWAISPETNLPRPGDRLSRISVSPQSIQEYNDTLDLRQINPLAVLIHHYLTMEEDSAEILYLTDGVETRRYGAPTDSVLWLSSRGWPGQSETLPADSMSCEFIAADSVLAMPFTRHVLHGTDMRNQVTGTQTITTPVPVTIITPEEEILSPGWKQVYRSDGQLIAMGDTIPVIEEIIRYYAEGFRYPIVEILNSEMDNAQTISQKAMYYPPEFQEEEIIEDEANETIRQQLAEARNNTKSSEDEHGSDTTKKDLSGATADQNTSSSWSDGMNRVSVYPTMVNQSFTVAYDFISMETTTVSISSMGGQIYQNSNLGDGQATGTTLIDCTSLPSGIYLVTVNHDTLSPSFKIVKR